MTVEKEDGQSEDLICQLKSTDANSIRVSKQDLDTLQHNAYVSHKLPVFAIQFLESNQVYLIMKPEALQDLAEYLKTGEAPEQLVGIDLSEHEDMTVFGGKVIKSSSGARERFHQEQQKQYGKRRRSAT